MKFIIFIQARMSSKRLPGKVLLQIKQKSILEHIFFNLNKSHFAKKIVVLTSKYKSDNKIVNVCKKNKISFYRGSLDNVYKRFVDALDEFKCDAFVRICADSPMIDVKIVDAAIKKFKCKKFDIVTNCFPKTYPKGQSVEVINSEVFIKNFKKVKKKSFLEHITKFFYLNHNRFKIFNIRSRSKKKYISLAVDNFKDFNFIKKEFDNICI
jgi:spore coat polysaccharide biosynthesis protein SpsF